MTSAMPHIPVTLGPQTWHCRNEAESEHIKALYERVYAVAWLMTGSPESAHLIQVAVMASAAMFVEMCEGPLGLPAISAEFRERAIDRQLMIELKKWIDFGPLVSSEEVSRVIRSERRLTFTLSELSRYLKALPASDRLMFIVRWHLSYSYERIMTLFNLDSEADAQQAALNSLRMMRFVISENVA